MTPTNFEKLRQYISQLDEKGLWALLRHFFLFIDIRAHIVHATGEHGMDVIAYVESTRDILHKGFNIIIQAKTGSLTLPRWRTSILYQLLEMPYYTIKHPDYKQDLARRIVLVVSGEVTQEARESIREYNLKHDVTLDVYDIIDLIHWFDKLAFTSTLLDQISTVGEPSGDLEAAEIPPIVGEISSIDDQTTFTELSLSD